MVPLTSLLVPILVSAVLVFLGSSILHMALPWHKSDYKTFANDDEIRAAIRKQSLEPGMYMVPGCKDMKEMGEPAMVAKFKEGPVAMLLMRAPAAPSMGKPLTQWFILCLAISFTCAYLAGHVLAPATPYLTVFRIVGTAGWLGYAGSSASSAIWYGKPWSNTVKEIIDGLIYGMLTAGTFGWLWPKM